MKQNTTVKLFEDKNIRTIWDEVAFSVVDIVGVLTDSVDAGAYWRKLKQRLKEESGGTLFGDGKNQFVTNCHELKQMKLAAADGKFYKTDVADTEQILRIIQSVPSPRAEPFKLWNGIVNGIPRFKSITLSFDNYKTEAIKIDVLSMYKSDLESDWFKSGILSAEDNEWNKQIAKQIAAGAKHIRIKLIDTNNNLILELQKRAVQTVYPSQIASGAEYYFMTRYDFDCLLKRVFPDGWKPHDFWLFDKTSGIEQFYKKDFSYKNDRPIPQMYLPKYIALRDAVLQSDKLFDINEFNKRYL